MAEEFAPQSKVSDAGASTGTVPELFEGAFDALPLSAAIIDASGTIIATNQAWRTFGAENDGDPEGQIGVNYLGVCHHTASDEASSLAADLRALLDGDLDSLEMEYPCHSPDQRRWYVLRAGRIERDGQVYALICHADVTARRLAEEEAFRRAAEDALTGLLNRRSFQERLSQALNQAKRSNTQLAVLYLDLDGFKEVNDSLGHAAGDEVLRSLAQRLQSALRRVDCLSRLGGDEFAMFLEDANLDVVNRVAQRIHTRLDSDVETGHGPLTVGASMGASFFPYHGNDVESLLRAADSAMYEAKRGDRYLVIAGDGFPTPPEQP